MVGYVTLNDFEVITRDCRSQIKNVAHFFAYAHGFGTVLHYLTPTMPIIPVCLQAIFPTRVTVSLRYAIRHKDWIDSLK